MVDKVYSVKHLVDFTEGFHRTSTIENLRDRSVVFVRDERWLWELWGKLQASNKNVFAFCHAFLWNTDMPSALKKRARPLFMWDAVEKFIMFHNEVNRNRQPAVNQYSPNCDVHPSVTIGVDGMRYVRDDDGHIISMKHMGNVVIDDAVSIDPYSVVHRATIDSTILGASTKIGTHCNIGHNVVIGKECFLTPRVCIGGSAKLGDNCWLGMGTVIQDNIQIYSDVKTGVGALVVKDITEPGLYFGVPAERKGDWDGKL